MNSSITPTVTISGPESTNITEKIKETKASACFQCEKCSNGCPLTFSMDVLPHQVIHALQLGMVEEILNSDTIWVCASCETCTTRCPNKIDIARTMDILRQLSEKRGVKKSQRQVPLFHRTFLGSIRMFGRVHEISMAAVYSLRNEGIGGIASQANLGITMLRKGKIRLIPASLTGNKRVKDIFRRVGKGEKR